MEVEDGRGQSPGCGEMAQDEGGGDSAGAPSGPVVASSTPSAPLSQGSGDAVEATPSSLRRTQPGTEKQGAREPCSGLDRRWAPRGGPRGPRGSRGQAAWPGMRRLNPGRAGDRLRSREQPQAGLALDPPSPAPAPASPGALGGLGVHILGPSGPRLSGTKSGSLKSTGDAAECTL